MTYQKNLNALLGVFGPAVFFSDLRGELADLAGELAGAGLIHKYGQRLPEAGALPGNPRADKKAEHRQSKDKQEVNDGDRPDAAADQFLQSSHCRINEVGKENGEKEKNQGSSRRIEKAQAHGKQKSREQNARRA